MLTFRTCREEDLGPLQLLVNELYADDLGDITDPNIRLTFEHLSNNPDSGRIVVFDDGGTLAGYAILINFWSNEFGGMITEIDELLVTREKRGKGIAGDFLNWLSENNHTGSVGCALQVSKSNSGALKLYEKMGFVATGNLYMVKLDASQK